MSYAELVLVFLALSCVPLVLAAVLRRDLLATRQGRWYGSLALTAVALFVLTAVFDSLMIAADLFRYEENNLSGLHVWLAPIEDFAWPLAAVLVVPPLALLFSTRTKDRS
jgi:lycopene cyclase domain-containing protein